MRLSHSQFPRSPKSAGIRAAAEKGKPCTLGRRRARVFRCFVSEPQKPSIGGRGSSLGRGGSHLAKQPRTMRENIVRAFGFGAEQVHSVPLFIVSIPSQADRQMAWSSTDPLIIHPKKNYACSSQESPFQGNPFEDQCSSPKKGS